jgi:hypothetical protein
MRDVATMAAPDLAELIREGHLRLAQPIDDEERRQITLARHWIQRYRADAWRLVYPDHRAPVPPVITTPIGDLTPPEHLAAIGGREAVESAFGLADSFRLILCAGLYARDGPGGPWAREYAAKWAELQAGRRSGINPSGRVGWRVPYLRLGKGRQRYQGDQMRTLSDSVPCGSCGARIVFLRTQSGSRMPVDAETVTAGDTQYEAKAGHVSHFKTCPNADQHRKTDRQWAAATR